MEVMNLFTNPVRVTGESNYIFKLEIDKDIAVKVSTTTEEEFFESVSQGFGAVIDKPISNLKLCVRMGSKIKESTKEFDKPIMLMQAVEDVLWELDLCEFVQ